MTLKATQPPDYMAAPETPPKDYITRQETQPPAYSPKQATQPPTYSPNGGALPVLQLASSSAQIPITPLSSTTNPILSPFSTTDTYGFYRTSLSDLYMAQHIDDRNPAFYVATRHYGLGDPHICLHAGPSTAGPVVGTADFGFGISGRTTINLTPQPNGRAAPGTAFETLDRSGFSDLQFSVFVEAPGRRETFDWKRSSGREVASLGGSSTGMKCVRTSTRETVAVMTGVTSMNKVGKMRYLGSRKGDLGARAEMMVLVSLLAVMEKARRSKNRRA